MELRCTNFFQLIFLPTEFLNRLDKIEENTAAMKAELDKLRTEDSHERQNYTETIRKQQGTIDTLLEMLSKK